MLKIGIGLIIPFVAIVIALPWINAVRWAPLNVPFVYWWLFLWFFLSTACLMVCWFGFDRNTDSDEEKEGQH